MSNQEIIAQAFSEKSPFLFVPIWMLLFMIIFFGGVNVVLLIIKNKQHIKFHFFDLLSIPLSLLFLGLSALVSYYHGGGSIITKYHGWPKPFYFTDATEMLGETVASGNGFNFNNMLSNFVLFLFVATTIITSIRLIAHFSTQKTNPT